MVWYVTASAYILDLFKLWLNTLFVIPFKKPETLWVLVPIWLNWILSEIFLEKLKTSMGNAMSNSVIVLWGAIDSIRQTVLLISAKVLSGFWNLFPRFALEAVILGYGILIILLGIKGKTSIRYIGRVREVCYICMMFIPVFYNAIPLSWKHFIATILFFPLFYFFIELINRITPNPKSIIEDENRMG